MPIVDRASRLVVIGGVNIDFATVVHRMPVQGETINSLQSKISPGGKGANQALAAAKIGADVTLLARVGDDIFAELVVSNLRANGVRVQDVIPVKGKGTGMAFIIISDGDNRIILDAGANEQLSATDIDRISDKLMDADGVLLQLEIPRNIVEKAILTCKGKVPIFLNPSPAIPLDNSLLNGIDYFLPNQVEALAYSGIDPVDDASAGKTLDYFRSLGVIHPVITMGNKGVAYFNGKKNVTSPAFPVEAVDSTAAGDAFAGVIAALVSAGSDLDHAVETAQAAAALTCTRHGAQEAIPTKSEVEEFLKAHHSLHHPED